MSYLLENFFTLAGSGLVKGSVYALVALGYTLVYGVLRLINFAHSEVWMWGAFGAVWVLIAVGGGSGQGLAATLGFILLAFAAAMLLSGAVALLVERVAYRRLRRQNSPPLVSLISAIGASFVLGEIMGLRDKIVGAVGLRDTLDEYVRTGRNDTPFANPVESSQLIYIGDFRMTNIDLIVVVGAILMMVILDQFVRRSRLGRGIRAVAMNPDAAALMGVNKDRIVQVTFFIGGIMAGGAAVFYLMRFGVVRWNSGFLLGVKAFTAAVLGGIGNIRGALLGGLVLGLAEQFGSAIFGGGWTDVVAFVLLIVILLFRPTGLLGESLGKARA